MTTIGQRVTKRLKELNMSEYALAKKLNMHHSNIQGLTSGRVQIPRYLGRLAEILEVNEKWMRTGEGPKLIADMPIYTSPQDQLFDPTGTREHHVSENTAPQFSANYSAETRNLPVYHIQDVDKHKQSFFIEMGNISNYISRPAYLAHNNAAFAIYIQNNQMEPRFEMGELIVIDPNRPPRTYEYVVVEYCPPLERPQHLVRRYLGTSKDKLILQQFSPAEEQHIPEKDVRSVLRIIPQNELLNA